MGGIRKDPRPWPLEDLLYVTGLTESEVFNRLGVSAPDRRRIREADNMLTDRLADRFCIKLGYWPFGVWDGWVEYGLEGAA